MPKDAGVIGSVPTKSWTGGSAAGPNPGTGGYKPPRDSGSQAHIPMSDKSVTKGVAPWTGGVDKRQSDAKGGSAASGNPGTPPVLKYQPGNGAAPHNPFDKPLIKTDPAAGSLAGAPPRHGGGLIHPVAPPPVPHTPPASDNLRLSVNVGVGAGIGFSAAERFGNTWVNFSFNNWGGCGNYSPYAYPGYSWCRPRYYHACGFDPYRHCNPWGGFYYVRRWPYYPFTYWYPGYTVSVNACGPWFRISYHRPLCGWLTDFRYCSTPCDTFADVALVTSGVAISAAIPVYALSTENTYRYTYVNPVAYAEVPYSPPTPVAEVLPAPASDAEIAHTTGRDLGDTYMRLGDGPSALRVYNAHIAAHPGDVRAIRSMGIAMIEAGQVESGAAAVERSYLIDPSLASSPFDRELLRDANGLTAVLDRATELAGRMDGRPQSASAWLTVSVLMQADGRGAPARAALDKAKAAGLNAKIVEEMQAALPNQ